MYSGGGDPKDRAEPWPCSSCGSQLSPQPHIAANSVCTEERSSETRPGAGGTPALLHLGTGSAHLKPLLWLYISQVKPNMALSSATAAAAAPQSPRAGSGGSESQTAAEPSIRAALCLPTSLSLFPIPPCSLKPHQQQALLRRGLIPRAVGLQDTAALPTLLPLVCAGCSVPPPHIPTRPSVSELWAVFPPWLWPRACACSPPHSQPLRLQPPLPHRNADPAWRWLGAAAGTWRVGADLGGELRNHSRLSRQT